MPPKKSNSNSKKSGDRWKTYKLLINDLPQISVLIAFFIFLATVSGSIFLIFYAPSVYKSVKAEIQNDIQPSELFHAGTLVARSPLMNKMNQEITFSVLLKPSAYVSGILKEDLELSIIVESRNFVEDSYDVYWSKEIHQRKLECTAESESYFCEPIIVFRERFIKFDQYRIGVVFHNLRNLYDYGMLDDVFDAKFEYINPQYTIFETVLRAQCFSLSLILFIFYLWFLLSKQSWSHCKTEQKWIILILFSLMLFNNPFFIADWLAVNWFFPLLNIIFMSTFASVLILFVMVITHSVVVKPKNRTFLWFYLPKLVVVGINWLLIIITLSWERLNQNTDPAYDVTEIPFFGQIRIAVISICVLWVVMIAYYVVRALSDMGSIGSTYELRFKYFWILTFLVIFATGIDFVTVFLMDYINSAAQFLSFFPLYNFYCITLAIFFLPSNTPEDDAQEVFASSMLLDEDFGDNPRLQKPTPEDEMEDLSKAKDKVIDVLLDDDLDYEQPAGKGKGKLQEKTPRPSSNDQEKLDISVADDSFSLE